MRKPSLLLTLILLTALAAPAQALDKAEDVLKAVVKIKAAVPEGARTAASFGTEREGHGILIDGRGHILTTGYLVIESETIEVTGPGGRKVKAAFVGYDHATGFGLVRAESPLGVEPIEFSRSAGAWGQACNYAFLCRPECERGRRCFIVESPDSAPHPTGRTGI
jgi:S1-C subfamily serine protease